MFPEKLQVFILITSFAVALRAIVSQYDYSGHKTPPMFGDYEAQRHWQEITINLPVLQWYENSTRNDLMYWGLDYPPLTAYHSWTMGKIANIINPKFIELFESRGIESAEHKTFMRMSVLLVDLLVYIPSVVFMTSAVNSKGDALTAISHLIVGLMYPGQILIDNGHFQYNNFSLGLAFFAIGFLFRDKIILAAISFSLALNYKQMELYHALPIFVYMLSLSLRKSSFFGKISQITKLGLAVIFVFGLLWLPWLSSKDSFLQVVNRIFPLQRGVFEDKVSNFWCSANVIIKLKTIFTNEKMAIVCLGTTLLASLPSCLNLFLKSSKKEFLYCIFNTALSFFLFSFQVHEKSILLVALPAIALYPFEPAVVYWFLQVSSFSMFPLLQKDGLIIPFFAFFVMFEMFFRLFIKKNFTISANLLNGIVLSNIGNLILVVLHLFGPISKALPHIYVLLISVYNCLHFLGFYLYLNYSQIFKINYNKS
ncbi:ALG6 family protein [Megaselia abdita]